MKEYKKIPIETVKKRLQAIKKYKKPDDAFGALFLCWRKHPKYKSPSRAAFNTRARTDGFFWLREAELKSFEAYCGYQLH